MGRRERENNMKEGREAKRKKKLRREKRRKQRNRQKYSLQHLNGKIIP
jgi:hypothetical protein